MGLLRLLLLGALGYWGYKTIKNSFSKSEPETEVKGKQKSDPLDLDDADISDAKFEDIEDDQ